MGDSSAWPVTRAAWGKNTEARALLHPTCGARVPGVFVSSLVNADSHQPLEGG